MADFSALKTSIQNYIKQNGNEEITGNLLQQILLSMVSTLGDSAINDLVTVLNNEVSARQNADGTLQTNINNETTARGNADTALSGRINDIINDIKNGYVYAGIATPSSTPASGKVFYLALTAGTYTNFGATVVPQGINILKYNGSAWSLDSFLGLDDAPTQESSNLVKSGGVLDSIIKDGSAFDLSAYNNGTTYADLSAALTALNALPAAYKKGGMSMKYVQSSDNKYIQARCMAQTFTTDVTQWQVSTDVIEGGSKDLVESGAVAELNFTSTNETHNLLTDISEQSTLKGYVDTNRDNKWIYDANRTAYMIPISSIKGSKILYKKSTLGGSSIAFFNNYPIAGSVAPFVSGTTLIEDDTIVEIPSGTAYLYVAGPYGTSDYLPSELISGTDIPSIVKQHTQQIADNTTDIEELKQDAAVFENILPQVLETTSYSIYINGSTVKYQQGRQSVFFNIEAYKGTHVKLVAGSGAHGSVIAILKSGAAIPNSSVEYATGYDALITESGEYFIPNDGNLLYVQISYNTIDFTPNTLGVVMSAAEAVKKEEARAKSVENTLSPKQFGYHNPALWCAPILPIVHGNRLELFKYGMTYQNFDFYDLCASISDHSALGDKYGRFRENAYFFDSDNNKQEFDITFRLKNDLEGYADIYGSTIQTHIVPFAKKSSPAQNKNILVVGDSWVEFGTWVNELSRRLLGNGGTPVADGLANLTFIGTKNSNHDGSEHIPCEGYGGKHIEWFLEDEASPFVFNGVFDVSQYVSTNNYSGIDYLLIVSGANAPTPIDAYKDFIDGFISYNPNIKILIGSNVMRYNPYGQFLAGGAAFNFLESGIKSSYTLYQRAYYWNKNVQEMCDEYTSNVVKYVDLPSQVDSLNNFGYEEVAANNRNNVVKVKMGTNNVHPTDAAYGQVADAFYNAFHYWCL